MDVLGKNLGDDTAFVGKDYNQDTFIAHDDRRDALDNAMASLDEAQNMEDISGQVQIFQNEVAFLLLDVENPKQMDFTHANQP